MSIEIIFTKSNDQLLEVPALQNRGTQIICPGPVVADNVRKKVHSKFVEVDVITMAKFVKDSLFKLDEFCSDKYFRKSRLVLELSTAWKIYFPDLSKEVFSQAYNLFTEFRSFSLDLSLMEEVFGHYDEKVVNGIKLFWLLLEERQIVDEHSAYNNMSLNAQDIYDEDKNYIFCGFPHMSGVQVDLMKSIGKFSNAKIVFPYRVFKESKNSDWIRWLSNEELEELEDEKHEIKYSFFQKNRLGESLLKFKKEKVISGQDFFLMTKSPSFEEVNEVNIHQGYFKSKIDIFSEKKMNVFNRLKFSGSILSEDFLSEIDNLLDIFLKDQDFVSLKIISLLKSIVSSWRDLSEKNHNVTAFDLDIFREVVELDLPRLYGIPESQDIEHTEILGIEGLDAYDGSRGAIVVASSSYQSLKGGGTQFVDEVLRLLSSIGPLKRKDLEFFILKEHLIEVLKHPDSLLLLEEGIEEHDLAWANIFNYYDEKKLIVLKEEYVQQSLLAKNIIEIEFDDEDRSTLNFSPTKIQKFIDCPRQYYLNYHLKLNSVDSLETVLLPNELGILEHKVIEEFYNERLIFEKSIVNELSKKLLDEYLAKKKVVLDKISYSKALIEVMNYSFNGISFLEKILVNLDDYKIEFEVNISQDMFKGSIDCVITSSKTDYLFDFKRSVMSVPTDKEIIEFNKIQLWYYLSHCPVKLEKLSYAGFVALENVQDSLIYNISDNEAGSKLELVKPKVFKESFEQLKLNYQNFEAGIVSKMKVEKDFLPIPRKSSVCTFCQVKNLCLKKEV